MLLLPNISEAFLPIKLYCIYSADFQFQAPLCEMITHINMPEQFTTPPLKV